MNSINSHLIVIILPLLITNVLHMLVVKLDLLSRLSKPIHEGFFGRNKTWRGLIFLTLVNAFFTFFITELFELDILITYWHGALLGLAYALFELPNSFIKRRIGIPSGGSHNRFPIMFKLIDKIDSPIGVMLTYFAIGLISFKYCLIILGLGILTHISVSYLLVILKIKKSF